MNLMAWITSAFEAVGVATIAATVIALAIRLSGRWVFRLISPWTACLMWGLVILRLFFSSQETRNRGLRPPAGDAGQ